MGLTRKTGQWALARAATRNMAARAKHAERVATLQEAHMFRAKVIEAFDTSGASNGQPWEPNKESVAALKKSSKPLIDRGDLRNSVAVVERGKTIFVGVQSTRTNRDGDRLVDIAAVHEFGKIIAIPVTPKMFRYVMAMMKRLGVGGGGGSSGGFRPGSVLMIRIPERSFIRATAARFFKPGDTRRRFVDRIMKGMGWPRQTGQQAKRASSSSTGGGPRGSRARDSRGRFLKGP